MSAVDQHAEAHRLKAAHGWGARRIAKELGITRYAAEQLLTRPLRQPAAEPQPVADVAEPRRPVAEAAARPGAAASRPVADRVAGHLAALVGSGRSQPSHRPRRLVIDLDAFPGLAEDLALLQRAGARPDEVVNFAVDRLATVYRRARAAGLLADGQPFDVVDMHLRPASPTRRTA
ncbi:hypothetical protein ACFOOM_07735 [Streptomyces echinoruber]|uniref:Uncharacterized protein n=1 Tax=Streptomyces echinoruber TaxID=68898 RepID=A0A918R3J9_9ACTN|nr:hypothetical protein [Streptomyces echinoruber]GGZ80445.1 hypothetical protein GCM10010389_17860 [Streptomyces echinoruber]